MTLLSMTICYFNIICVAINETKADSPLIIYGHLAPGGNKDAVDRLDDIIENATIRNLSATKEKGISRGVD